MAAAGTDDGHRGCVLCAPSMAGAKLAEFFPVQTGPVFKDARSRPRNPIAWAAGGKRALRCQEHWELSFPFRLPAKHPAGLPN